MVVNRCAGGARGLASAVSIQVYHGAAAASSSRMRRSGPRLGQGQNGGLDGALWEQAEVNS